jgi:dihydrodipicolinate synthase/N-acetylneuraminate lyase
VTHYDRTGAIDTARERAHWRWLSKHVKGFLVPGSTGDAWDLTSQESQQVLELALEEAPGLGIHILVGVLKPTADEMLATLSETLDWLKSRSGETDPDRALARLRVCGFTFCAPRGRDLSQEQIGVALPKILERGLPSALYQLPQVTQNEIGPDLASSLAKRFENFLFFKDSSGADRIILSGKGLDGVFAMRGGEGDYHRWLDTAGGPYNGFLLGSANCFAAQYHQIIEDLSAGHAEAAQELSARVTAVVREVASLVTTLPTGNPFANANKALDHYFAWGPRAASAPPPHLRGGSPMPLDTLRATGESLERHRLLPAEGYLAI